MSSNKKYQKALELARDPQPDFDAAAELLESAFQEGSADAAYALGSWHFYGRHFRKDTGKAIEFWEKAAASGNVDAQMELAVAFERGEEFEPNIELALKYYLSAAMSGSGQACYEVSRFFYHGIFVPKSKCLSNMFYDRSKELGYSEDD